MAAELRLDGRFTGSAASCRFSAHSNLPYLAVLLWWPMITKGQLRPLCCWASQRRWPRTCTLGINISNKKDPLNAGFFSMIIRKKVWVQPYSNQRSLK